MWFRNLKPKICSKYGRLLWIWARREQCHIELCGNMAVIRASIISRSLNSRSPGFVRNFLDRETDWGSDYARQQSLCNLEGPMYWRKRFHGSTAYHRFFCDFMYPVFFKVLWKNSRGERGCFIYHPQPIVASLMSGPSLPRFLFVELVCLSEFFNDGDSCWSRAVRMFASSITRNSTPFVF